MRLLPCVLPACAIFFLGCSSQNEFDDLRSRIDKGFMATLPSDGSFSIRALKRLTGMVDTETDPVIREQGRRYLEKRILSFEVDKLSYQHQSNYQDILLKFGYHEGMGFRSASVQEGWEVRLRTLNRLRSELRRLRPVTPANVQDMDFPTYVAYRRWRNCYNGAARAYERTLRWMEKSLLPSVLDGLTETERSLLSARVESFIGRKIRTAAECECDSREGRHIEFPLEVGMRLRPSVLVPDSSAKPHNGGLGEVDYSAEWRRMRGLCARIQEERDAALKKAAVRE